MQIKNNLFTVFATVTESLSPQALKRHQASVITIHRLSVHHPFGAIMIPKAVHRPRSSMDAKVKQKVHCVTDNSTNRHGAPSYPIPGRARVTV